MLEHVEVLEVVYLNEANNGSIFHALFCKHLYGAKFHDVSFEFASLDEGHGFAELLQPFFSIVELGFIAAESGDVDLGQRLHIEEGPGRY